MESPNIDSNLFIARQPILNLGLNTFAYELLFRSGCSNQFDGVDQAAATNSVISNTFLSFGIDRVMGECKCFVNFPRDLLVSDDPLGLPPEKVLIEVLETVDPDPEVIRACRRLKDQGYHLALDDFVNRPDCGPLVDLADFVKIDFCATSPSDCRAICSEFRKRGIRMLAEKVETQEVFENARGMGYGYFQGYFFAKPQILTVRDIPVPKINALRLLHELHRPELDFSRLDHLIRNDLSTSYKLLRLLNSAAFGWIEPVDNIFHGLVMLGEDAVRKWVALAATANLAVDRVPELARTAVSRARLCELIAERTDSISSASEFFLMGLFSLLDVMLGRPLAELLPEIGLHRDICSALCRHPDPSADHFRCVLDLCLACEEADLSEVKRLSGLLNLPCDEVAGLNLSAMSWADGVWTDGPPNTLSPQHAAAVPRALETPLSF